MSKDRILPDCLRAAIQGTPIFVRNPHSIRPYQHVFECLQGYLMLAEKQYYDKARYEGAYNFGPAERNCVETSELTAFFCSIWEEKTGKRIFWEAKMNSGPHETMRLRLNSSKAHEILKWQPKWDVCKGIEKTIEWTLAFLARENMGEFMSKQWKEYIGG